MRGVILPSFWIKGVMITKGNTLESTDYRAGQHFCSQPEEHISEGNGYILKGRKEGLSLITSLRKTTIFTYTTIQV